MPFHRTTNLILKSLIASSAFLLVQSQRIPVELKLDSEIADIEYGKSSQFTCSWNLSDAGVSQLDLAPDEPIQLTWLFNDQVIYTLAQRDEYKAVASFETTFADRPDVSAVLDYENSTSTLSINEVALKDAGSYRCRVKLSNAKTFNDKLGYASGTSDKEVGVFATPEIMFNEASLEFDTRDTQMKVIEAELLTGNDTATAEPIVLTNDMGSCSIKNAFPKPTSIKLFIGSEARKEVNSSGFEVTENSDGLFDVDLSFSTELNGATDNQQFIYCHATDADKWAASSSQNEKTLEVKYLPTEISVQFSVESDVTDAVFEGDSVDVSCVANGNPAVETVLTDGSSNSTTQETYANSTTQLVDVKRGNEQSFQCSVASIEEFPSFEMVSDVINMSVNYLDRPIISIEGAINGNEITNNAPSIVGLQSEATIKCTVDSRPSATFEWFKQSKEAKPSDEWTQIPSPDANGALVLKSIDYDAMGNYKCRATNGDVSKESNPITIHVYGECKINEVSAKHDVVTSKDNKKQNKVTFTCAIDDKVFPECKVKWIYEKSVFGAGSSNGNKLTFDNFKLPDDVNAVTCQAENAYRTFATIKAMSAEEIKSVVKIEASGVNTTYVIVGIVVVLLIGILLYIKKSKKSSPPEEEENNKLNSEA